MVVHVWMGLIHSHVSVCPALRAATANTTLMSVIQAHALMVAHARTATAPTSAPAHMVTQAPTAR